MKAIFSCFNLKSGDRFLSYNMTEVVNIPPLLKGERGGVDLPKIESLRVGVQKFLLESGDKPEKGGLM